MQGEELQEDSFTETAKKGLLEYFISRLMCAKLGYFERINQWLLWTNSKVKFFLSLFPEREDKMLCISARVKMDTTNNPRRFKKKIQLIVKRIVI